MAYNSMWNDISHMNYTCKHIYCFDFCRKAKSRDFHQHGGAFVSNFSKMAPWHKMKGKGFLYIKVIFFPLKSQKSVSMMFALA